MSCWNSSGVFLTLKWSLSHFFKMRNINLCKYQVPFAYQMLWWDGEGELYFRSGDPGLIMKIQFELIISGKVTCPPCNFTSLPVCLLSGHGKFMVLHCNCLQRTLICATFVGGSREAQTLTPEFPRGPLNPFWKCAEGEVSCTGRVRTVWLTLLAGAGTI